MNGQRLTQPRLSFALVALMASLVTGCASGDSDETPSATVTVEGVANSEVTLTPTETAIPTATSPASRTPAVIEAATAAPQAAEEATATPTPLTSAAPPTPSTTSTATPPPMPSATAAAPAPTGMDIQATRLQIPVLGIDSVVHPSQQVPDTSPMPPGCPAKPLGQTTLTVPPQGIATPEESFPGLERKSWIYGHSRWQGEPGLLFSLQFLDIGDEVFIDGVDRESGASVTERRFVVDGLFLADTVSGGSLVTTEQPVPTSQVILQTSVRERGEGKAWILDRATLLQKSVNVIEGDIEDPCKYLLLFVVASAS